MTSGTFDADPVVRGSSKAGAGPDGPLMEQKLDFAASSGSVAQASSLEEEVQRMKAPEGFLDRDGTLMLEVGYCSKPADVHLIPGAASALRRLREAGYRIVIVTNQSGIGRGYYTDEDFQAVQEELMRQLGGRELIDATYYCPDHPEAEPQRRKPAPDMLHDAARDLDLDLARSYMVGDREGDITAGFKAGCRTVLVLSGEAKDARDTGADGVASSIVDAADWILAHRLFTTAGYAVDTLRTAGAGDDSTAWLVNNRIICRVPKNDGARQRLRREALMLPQVAGKLPLAVPNLSYFEDHGFSTHLYLPGDQFTLQDFKGLFARQQSVCLEQLAGFLRALHACRPAGNASLLATADYRERFAMLEARAAQYLFPHLDAAASMWIEQTNRLFERYEPVPPVLLHGDLSPEHILWDRNAKRITAIIDFGDMEWGDPAWDLVYFWEDYDEAFVEAFLAASKDMPHDAVERSRLFFHINTIHYAAGVMAAGAATPEAQEQLEILRQLSR